MWRTDTECLGGVVWQDEGRRVTVEVREVFRQRKDKLQERRAWPLKDTTWELLGPGARGALKQATIVKGQRKDLLFYHQVPTKPFWYFWLIPFILGTDRYTDNDLYFIIGYRKSFGNSWATPADLIPGPDNLLVLLGYELKEVYQYLFSWL